ncbi:H-NS histone family protein [Burkholderia cepacia]|nr:H-NS histone family protein [Burkholderia cepacia]RQT91822.1 H-NS histone family protein [Burkholderia cepacia]RQZ67874.1 H-NS histone family protein [Burkholderia cepacia]RQZ90184.1 H-NS histone family protein [Burkholderia cepacia]RQZ95537.1 H-NS histone family protein [Burkholderia cepacia]
MLAQYALLRREIDMAREREIKLVVERILAELEASGISYGELLRCHRAKLASNRRSAPKYWNKSTGETWSGRGREPHWIVGQDRNEFLLPKRDDGDSGNGFGTLEVGNFISNIIK